MNHTDQIEIALSKKKIAQLLLGSIAFVAMGLWFLINPPKTNHIIFGNQTLIFITGLASVLLGGLGSVLGIFQLSNKKPGLIINRHGLIPSLSGASVGLISWEDIQEMQGLKINNQKIIMFIVRNPQDYLNRVSNPIKRKIMEMTHKSYGSPLSISASTLQISFEELYQLLHQKLVEYKS